MALVYADRVKETTTTTGTGTINLAGAATGFQTFVAGIGNGNTVKYCITDGTDWEVGEGTVTDGTPDTLSRTTIHSSSNAGSAVNWGAGTKDVFGTLPAADFPAAGGGGAWNLIQTQTVTSSVTSVEFTSGIDDTYDTYVVVFEGITMASDGYPFTVRISTNGGSSYVAFGYAVHYEESTSNHNVYQGGNFTSTTYIRLSNSIGNATGESTNGVAYFHNLRNTSNNKIVAGTHGSQQIAGAYSKGTVVGGHATTAAVNALQFGAFGQNITSGKISLYGISN